MTRKILLPILMMLLTWCFAIPASAEFIREYTKERPLVITSDWEFPPYEYMNDMGTPDGYIIDVLDLVLDKLDIPHKFVMQEWYKCMNSFESREADLIHALSSIFDKRPYVMTQNMITYYNVKVARHRMTKPIVSIDQFSNRDTVILKRNDYGALKLLERRPAFHTEYHSSREALTGLLSGKYKYYIWGENPLKIKLKELAIDNIELDPIDIPAGELHIIGYDEKLIAAIDDMYARLEQSGEIEKIRDKWFYPERVHHDSSPVSLIVLITIIILGIIAFLLSRLIKARVKAAVKKSIELNQMMKQALDMGNFYVIDYDVKTRLFKNIYGNLLPERGIPEDECILKVHPDVRERFIRDREILLSGKESHSTIRGIWNIGTEDSPEWHHIEGHIVAEKENNKVTNVIYTFKDLTEAIDEEMANKKLATTYQQMFDTSLVAMSFYNKDGVLIDLNENMKKLCEFDEESERYFRQTSFFDVPVLKGQYEKGSKETLTVGQHMYYPELNIDKRIEIRVQPIFDEVGEIHYYAITARDVTDERRMYLEEQKHAREINKASEQSNIYEQQLHYILEKSDMYVWKIDLKAMTVALSRSLREFEYTESLDAYSARMFEDKRVEAAEGFKEAINAKKSFNVIHHFKYTHNSKTPAWYAVSGVPTLSKSGKVIGYFGIARNITNLMLIQNKLKEETSRAENSGKMKGAFLANMTHEIRTPLNAIVGFSDLLPMVDTKEERMEFIRIIRNNCDMLMRLINDILMASNMSQALSILPKDLDFAKAFEDICQTLAQRVQEPGVEFIKENPYETYETTLDNGRTMQILTNFTTNAVKYTHQGHIKVGYHYEQRVPLDGKELADGLYFYCEDTGAGIPKDKQASVFERFVKLNDFVQGTGLGLSICQAIVDRCKGFIGVTSEGEGHGSTFWMWIPCERRKYAEK